MELFPGQYFGEHYFMDDKTGIFPRQANGPMKRDEDGNFQITPIAIGKKLIIAPTNIEKELNGMSFFNKCFVVISLCFKLLNA